MRLVAMLLAFLACGIQVWSYRITDNYTIEVKFKINAVAAGIAFRAYEGFNSDICMWQFNVGDGSQSKFRPHDWKVGGILLAEYDTRTYGEKSVTLNTTDWFITKIVISNNGGHAATYLRRANGTDDDYILLEERDGNFRFGIVGTRQHKDGGTSESASYDYFKVTANETDEVLYFEDFNTTNGDWRNNPTWDSENGFITTVGGDSEVKYFPNNMFQDAVKMHYAVEADVTIESGFVSFVFGLTDSGTNYMWQISPNRNGDHKVSNYYHLDNGNESWKAHAGGPDYPGFSDSDFYNTKRHVKIEVVGNVVYTYIDDTLVDTFVQCDLTDLELLNPGKIGVRADGSGSNDMHHKAYIDNIELIEYSLLGTPSLKMLDSFSGGKAHYFEIAGKDASYASVVSVDGDDYALLIDCDGTTDDEAKVRLIQTDICYHNYENGICRLCDGYEEPGYDALHATYTIGNLGQLIRFSEIVNTVKQNANGALTNDIDMESSNKFTPIGLNNDGDKQTPFRGHFYGNNHVIRNLYVRTDCEGGLFSRLRGGYIENLGLENAYIESTANMRCGAIAGEHHDNAYMYNCFARGTFEFVTGHSQKDALAAEAAGGYFFNCYTTLPKITCDYPAPFGGEATNCYEDVSSSDAATTNGELCYNLCTSPGSAFRQTIGTDTYPELDQTHGIVNKITAAGYTTQYIPDTDVTIPTGVKAYAGIISGDYLSLVEIEDAISKDDAVILKGSEGYYNFMPTTGVSAAENNDLQGTEFDMLVTRSGIYALANLNSAIGFYPVASNSTVIIPKSKAYLDLGSSGVKGFTFLFDDDATAISDLKDSKDLKAPIFNLAGQKIDNTCARKGIYIVNGKKMVIGK